MLNFKLINKLNIDLATEIQMEIFPNECAYNHYLKSIMEEKDYIKYYLVYDDNRIIGITGLYTYDDINDTKSLWLGWFGIIEKYRKKGFGKQTLKMTIDMAKELSKKYPIKYFRLYTSTIDNPIAQILYKEVMDICEEYNNENDFNYDNTCLIYSKSINNDKIEKWNNRFLNLKRIIQEEKSGYKEYMNCRANNEKLINNLRTEDYKI